MLCLKVLLSTFHEPVKIEAAFRASGFFPKSGENDPCSGVLSGNAVSVPLLRPPSGPIPLLQGILFHLSGLLQSF